MSNNPLLSWDDWDESENPAIRAASAAVKQIDTTEAEKELAAQAQAYQAPATPIAPVVGLNEDLMKRAINAISNMDGELPHGGRLKAEDKKLLNSATDLNQLVPFKYDWAWAAYLESCNAHWMPSEIPLERDLIELQEMHEVKGKNVRVVGTNDCKILTNMLVNHIYLKHAVPNMTWLNLYRLLENPECRQYLLRQTFEETLMDHAMSNIQESLGLMVEKSDGFTFTMHLHLLEDTYKERHKLLREFLPTLIGETGTTVGKDNVREFIVELALLYGFVDWISYLVPIYQVMKVNKNLGKFNGVAANADKMLRDLVHHQQIFRLVLDTAIAENPEAVDSQLQADFVGRMKRLIAIQEDFLSLLVVDDGDYLEITWLMNDKFNEIKSALGIQASERAPINSPFLNDFVKRIHDHRINLHGGGASVLAQSGGALSWN